MSDLRTDELFRLRKVPSSVMPYTRREDFMRMASSPFLVYAPLMVLMVTVQYFIPAPRIGVESLWDADLRTVIGIVAIAPSLVMGGVRTRYEFKHHLAPTIYAKEAAFSAVFGALLAGLVAWSLGAPLTPIFSTVAFLLTFLWITVTGIVAIFISGTIRLSLLKKRLKRAQDERIEVPFEMSAQVW